MRVLHFAPERMLSALIAKMLPVAYVKCDLLPTAVDVLSVDIESIPFDDCLFDLLVANHVLEHVSDDLRALREIRRVLVPNGLAILQTPYSSELHCTWSDPGIMSRTARLHAYGQEDHVRLFGRDIFDRISSVGLVPSVRTHEDVLAAYDPAVFGVNAREPFFLFKRAS